MSTNRTENRTRRHAPAALRSSLRAALAAVSGAPAVVFTDRLNNVGTNPPGQALLALMLDNDGPIWPVSPFLHEKASSAFYPEWGRIADRHIHSLRRGGTRPARQSTAAADRRAVDTQPPLPWAPVRAARLRLPPATRESPPPCGRGSGTDPRSVAPAIDPRLTLRVYTAGPGTATDERLHILASWSQEAAVAESTKPDGAH